MDTDVIIIGAGLTGLRCAASLKSQGLNVTILEASETVGGRVKTENHDGFLCDVGFQLLNPAYPLAQKHLDLPRLALGQFNAGVQVRTDRGRQVIADPRRAPRWAAATLRSGLWSTGELKALVSLLRPVLANPAAARRYRDLTWTDTMESVNLNGPLRHSVLEPFLAGVLADWSGTTNGEVVASLLRYFVMGTPGLPREGMQSIARQLAEPVRGELKLNHRVQEVRELDSGVEVRTDSGTLTARYVACATGLDSLPLAGFDASTVVKPHRGLSTWWFSAGHSNSRAKFLAVDGRRGTAHAPGPLVNAGVVSAAQPSYAPHGRHLIQATAVLNKGDACPTVDDVMTHAADLLGLGRASWELITTHHVPAALPAFATGVGPSRDTWVTDRIAAAGDTSDSPSIQGAMSAGDRLGQSIANRAAAADGQARASSLT